MRTHQELRDRSRAASACVGASRGLLRLVHGALPPRMVDARLEALSEALAHLAADEGLRTATPGHVALVTALGRSVARDVVLGHVRSTRAHSPEDATADQAEALAVALDAALDHLSTSGPDDAPDWSAGDEPETCAYGPSHGDVLGPMRVLAHDCLGMVRAGPREAAMAAVHASRMAEAVTVLGLVLMDREPLDASQVSHVLDTFERSADHLDAMAANWTRLDASSPEAKLGRAVRSSVELVREPVTSAFRTEAPTPGM